MVSYRKRESWFETGETEWLLDGDRLVRSPPEGRRETQAVSKVKSVRLCYAPTEYKTWRYVFDVRFENGMRWRIDNGHFLGLGDFEDRSATFTVFVKAVISAVNVQAPAARAYLGSEPVAYFLQVAMLAVVFSLGAAVLLLLPLGEGVYGILFAKLGIIAFLTPVVVLWMRKSYPRSVPINAVPEDAFPPSPTE